jgi:hypothetical protein
LTEKQTKLASYWNNPFDKICLGMKVEDVTKWISLQYNARSLHSVIKDENFKRTSVGKEAWRSLIDDSSLQKNCNIEGFNINGVFTNSQRGMKIRVGLMANNQDNCNTCNSCIGFGTSVVGCSNDVRNTSCGVAVCGNAEEAPAFGYILVQ